MLRAPFLALSMTFMLVARRRAAAWNADNARLPGDPLAHGRHAAHSPAAHLAFPAIREAFLHAAAEACLRAH